MKKLLSLLLISVALTGCGPSTSSVPVTPPPTVEEIKQGLKSIAETGQLDSGIVFVEQKIDELKTQDAAKAEAIAPIFQSLKTAKSPADAKKHAKAILEQL